MWLLLAAGSLSAQSSLTEPHRDLNAATAEQLESVRGIGAVKARLIIKTREQIGGFRHFDELHAVPRLSRRDILALRRHLRIATPERSDRQSQGAGRSDSK